MDKAMEKLAKTNASGEGEEPTEKVLSLSQGSEFKRTAPKIMDNDPDLEYYNTEFESS